MYLVIYLVSYPMYSCFQSMGTGDPGVPGVPAASRVTQELKLGHAVVTVLQLKMAVRTVPVPPLRVRVVFL